MESTTTTYIVICISALTAGLLFLYVLVGYALSSKKNFTSSTNGTTSSTAGTPSTVPVSVNYHFTRQCNYQCGFCFHTAKTSFVLPIEEAKRGLQMLKDNG